MSFFIAGKISSIGHQIWIDFLRMFSGLKDLTITQTDTEEKKDFWPSVLEVMPRLTTLSLSKCGSTNQTFDILADAFSLP